MTQTIQYIAAPKIDAKTLWEMSADDFNEWRKKNDYPRIISFLKLKLPKFNEWMQEQSVTDDMLIEYTPSKLIQNVPKVYLYTVSRKDVVKKLIDEKSYFVGELWYHQFIINERIEIIPYKKWYYSKHDSNILPLRNRTGCGRKLYLMHELELLDLGNFDLDNKLRQNLTVNDGIKSRTLNLDFVNLNDLRINHFNTGYNFRIWFSSAENISINGDFHFVNAYYTPFYSMGSPKATNLKLSNGSFQRWTMIDSDFDFNAINCNIIGWKFKGLDFYASISNSDISNCDFKISNIKYKNDYNRAKELNASVKRIYSQIGKRKEASKYFYLEKQFERKAFCFARDNFSDEYYDFKKSKSFKILFFYFKYFLKYLKSSFLNFLWGYGERPVRVFYVSFLLIFFCAFIYCFYPASVSNTKGNFINSIYYSIVTFTTLGYGDILQKDDFLKILSAIEALLGMSFWGILIAGFTNNSKDY